MVCHDGELTLLESSNGENSCTVYKTCRLCRERGVLRDGVVIASPAGVYDVICSGEGSEVSLKLGLGTRCVARKSEAGTSPEGDGTMQIVPPVMIIKTLDSVTGPSLVLLNSSGKVGANLEM